MKMEASVIGGTCSEFVERTELVPNPARKNPKLNWYRRISLWEPSTEDCGVHATDFQKAKNTRSWQYT